jgi:hypothetical protein
MHSPGSNPPWKLQTDVNCRALMDFVIENKLNEFDANHKICHNMLPNSEHFTKDTWLGGQCKEFIKQKKKFTEKRWS